MEMLCHLKSRQKVLFHENCYGICDCFSRAVFFGDVPIQKANVPKISKEK